MMQSITVPVKKLSSTYFVALLLAALVVTFWARPSVALMPAAYLDGEIKVEGGHYCRWRQFGDGRFPHVSDYRRYQNSG